MKIHWLQHVPFEGLGTIESWAINLHHSLSSTKFYRNESLPSVKNIDCLIVMGGPMNIYEDEKYPWLTQEKRFIGEEPWEAKVSCTVLKTSQVREDLA